MNAPGSEREFEGPDLDAALRAASAALGVSSDEIAYELVEEGRKGVFGLGARLVRIRARVDATPTLAVAVPERAKDESDPTPKEAPPEGLVETLTRMFALAGLEATVNPSPHAGGWTLDVAGPGRKALVKRDGELLRAFEFVLNRMARRRWPSTGSIRLETAGFRDRRDAEIADLAREVAGAVSRTGRSEVLDEMNPYERRIVHVTVREIAGVRSVSDGDGFLKRVRVEKIEG